MEEKRALLQISRDDNVAVALRDLSEGQTCAVGGRRLTLAQAVPFGHKVALRAVSSGSDVIKYGYPIGHATRDIFPGEHVHSHNLATNLSGLLDYAWQPAPQPSRRAPPASFEGYVRPDGSVGVRNEIWILPTVGCVNATANLLAKEANRRFAGKTDGVLALPHNMGCSQLGDDMLRTQRLLKALVNHPNAGGVLVLSLGCENNNVAAFQAILGETDPRRVKFLVTQDVEDEYEAGMACLCELAEYAAAARRQTVPASKLVLGFKCGGSDAFSGITANALCGRVNDRLVACGGTTLLTEVPEMFGAETLLMKRAASEAVFHRIVALINDFKRYYMRHDQPIYENPSPGNRAGGITTLEEKSLGCTQKGGSAQVTGVLDWGEQATPGGLNLQTGPGNDPISCTNLTAAGAQMILFTTGRGNPFGAPVPTVKISSNSLLASRKPHWIDFDAGRLLNGTDMETAEDQLFQYVLDVASGRVRTANEENGYREISIFRDGVIL